MTIKGADSSVTDAPPPVGATVRETSLNVAKMCMGTGTLALPFAAEKGGLVFNVAGLLSIGLWNYYSAGCLLRCLECAPWIDERDEDGAAKGGLLKDSGPSTSSGYGSAVGGPTERERESDRNDSMSPPPEGTTTYGTVAWYASGTRGLMVLDVLMLLLFFGIVIAYEVAMTSFIADMPFTTGSRKLDLMVPSAIVAILSCAKDMRFLSKFSGMGLIAMGLSFAVISLQGLAENGFSGFGNSSQLSLWPESVADACSWFGVVVFGYGVVPFVFNFRNSMANPEDIRLSLQIGLFVVFLGYVVISNGIRVLFSPSYTFDGDVLQAMPDTWISLMVRILMTFVIVFTVPLIIVPFGEFTEGKLGIDKKQHHKAIAVRLTICGVCTTLSLILGSVFVKIVSFIGCFCVSMAGFVLPPLFCIRLSYRGPVLCDAVAFLLGIVATALTSTLTFRDLMTGTER